MKYCRHCGQPLPEAEETYCDEICEDFSEDQEKVDINHDALERADIASHR